MTKTISETVLEAKGITKKFPGVLANDKVNFDLRKGEIHALLGENGAGKSTLMNVLYGLYHPEAGEVFVNGKLMELNSSRDAIHHGIGMVHQHFMLIPVFTVTENIMLGAETDHRASSNEKPLVILDRSEVSRRVRELSHKYGLDVDPDAIIGDLPVGVQQRVEIVKALYRKASILILDEPTAVLTPQESEDLFRIMHELTQQGVSIVFITHKLKEVLKVADRITVMRAGQVVGTAKPKESTEQSLAEMMVGREVILTVTKKPSKPAEEVLRVEDLRVKDVRGLESVRGVSFSVKAGEVVGIAGVQGNGQTELAEALTGLRSIESGHFTLSGKDLSGKSPRQITETGLAHIPEDRQRHGLVLSYSVADNMMLCDYYQPRFSKGVVVQQKQVDTNAQKLIKDYDVRTPSAFVAAGKLSGGNQQKVIVARELSRPVKLVVASQPTRGLDVGSIEYIHNEIIAMRDRGVGVLLVSAELDEIMSLSDRIIVMYSGKIVATVNREDASREQLGLWMAGAQHEQV
ncbi:MAG TPA: heme ABC transporter ATP-binding protein [Anaerolineae bacterium]|nr:heme ABC transporter ATP-binding protein [Anaerolineae bacterium]